MTREPGRGADRPPPGSVEAADTLAELEAIVSRSRRASYATVTRAPLVMWGVAWLVGYLALDTLNWAIAVPLGMVLSISAAVGTWLKRSAEVVNGWERRVRLSWLVLMVSSPLLVITVSPTPVAAMLLFLGALWGIALLLYAVAAADLALGIVGTIVLVAAPLARTALDHHELLVYGVLAGGAMITLGLRRMRLPG